jgi:hypothetical protein
MKIKSLLKLPTKPCKYCGKDVKLPFQYHKECKRINKEGINEILSLTIDCVVNLGDIELLDKTIIEISSTTYIDSYNRLQVISDGVDKGVDIILKSKDISTTEEGHVNKFIVTFNGIQEHLKQLGTLSKIEQTKLLSQIRKGNIPDLNLDSNHPLLKGLMKSEKLVYIFPQEVYYYRIMDKGLKYEYLGGLSVTTKHLYFVSERDSFRIRYDSIINIFPRYSGVVIHKNSSSEKPKVFKYLDGEFLIELIDLMVDYKSDL